MFFIKEKMNISTFITEMSNFIIKTPKETYEEYLAIDKEMVLSKDEFDDFISKIESLRLILLMGNIFDSNAQTKYKYTSEEIGKNFSLGVYHSYLKNSNSEEEAQEKLLQVSELIDNYFKYLESIDSLDLNKNNFTIYVCMYFAQNIMKMETNDVMKNGTIVSLINGNRKLISDYFNKVYKKVNLIK